MKKSIPNLFTLMHRNWTARRTIGSMTADRFGVGDYRLAAEVTGWGTPAVVFVPGLGDTSRESFAATQAALGTLSTFVDYARPGIGESDPQPSPSPRTCGAAATELRALLRAADVESPYVLVGHSMGALVCQAYAMQWPADVAGLVLVDSTDPRLYLEIGEPRPVVNDGDDEGAVPFDLVGSVAELESGQLPTVPAVVVTSRVGRWLDSKVAHMWRPFSLSELDDRWQHNQRALAQALEAPQKIATAGGHYVQKDQPQLVADAIHLVVEAVRAREIPGVRAHHSRMPLP